ncbi:M48 family metallopeptidase [Limibacter armeniacum]|uniref:M48 family metallopeptidase n=1 Tax=Limibacter armeniacum TaxID=466084 RepID=UPI002FE5661C
MKKLFLIVLLLWMGGCSKVPITGRNQITLVSNSEILALSQQNYKEVLKESKLSNDADKVAQLRKIGNKISAAVEEYLKSKGKGEILQGYKWEFNLIESEQQNAWAMPGGKVAFYTGILPVCKNEDGIAVVMSHEIAHAIAQHGNERMSQQMVAQGLGTALDVALANQSSQTRSAAMAAFGAGAQVGVLLPYSRKQESEADILGLYFMAMAGYNLDEAPEFWKRMAGSGGQAPPEILSTHPSNETRIKQMEENIPKAREYAKTH